VTRPAAEFTKDKRRRDGLAFYCRDHSRQRLRESKLRRMGPPTTRRLVDIHVPVGSKWCPDCDSIKSLEDFPRSRSNRTGRHTYCLVCHNARGRATLEKVGGSRTYHLKRRYGITAQDADALLAQQGGLCAICRAAPAAHVDHDHETGAVRALLCFNCNGGLGQFRDDPLLLQLAAAYVEGHRSQQLLEKLAQTYVISPDTDGRAEISPVGSERDPERTRGDRVTGRTSGSRRRKPVGEADG
jgi:hypothetical protein